MNTEAETQAQAPQVGGFVCLECQRAFQNGHAMHIHQTRAHGGGDRRGKAKTASASKAKCGPYKGPRRMNKQSRTELPQQVRILFDLIVHEMHERAQIVEECVAGLTRVLDESAKLREGYIQKAKEIGTLRKRINELEQDV